MITFFSLFLAVATSVPAGAKLQVRLQGPVSSIQSPSGDRIEAVVIAPVRVGGETLIESGYRIYATVRLAERSKPDKRAQLSLEFSIPARLVEVDNARESVDSSGRILGILTSETLSAQVDRGLEKLGEQWADLAGILGAAKALLIKDTDPEISYPAGVELTLELTRPLTVNSVAKRSATPIPDTALERLVAAQPLRTVAERPALPSDFTNLLFAGSRSDIEKAFEAAGWSPAVALRTDSVIETARAIIEARGYKEAPVSTILLEGRTPDMVFQKMNNTFARRHHLRIWRRPESYMGRDVWLAAATHDIGIAFAPDSRTFFHTIDPNVDKERLKIVNDLLYTRMVSVIGEIERPSVPHESTNATGDRMVTDGRLVALSVNALK